MNQKRLAWGGVALVVSLFTSLVMPRASAACNALPTDSQSTQTVSLASAGTYRLWLRTLAPTNDRNSVFVQIDDQCPVNAGDGQTNAVLAWMSHRDGDLHKSLAFELAAGEHTVKLAARDAGTGVDKALLTTDTNCVPVDNGDNCPSRADQAAGPTTEQPASTPPKHEAPHESQHKKTNLWLLLLAVILALVALGFLAWQYRRFLRNLQQYGTVPAGASWPSRTLLHARLFFGHNKILVVSCLGVALVSLIVGVAAAEPVTSQSFEIEAATLSGHATKVNDSKASGGAYVLFGQIPGQPKTGGKTGGGSSGSSGGGGSSSSGGCPAYPAFPTPQCTGWEHTGITLQTVNDIVYVDKPNTVLDGKDFRGGVVIKANNVTIKRSRVKKGTEGAGYSGIWVDWDVTGTLIEDIEITSNSRDDRIDRAITAGHTFNTTMRRVYVHNTQRGLEYGAGTLIEDSWVGDFYNPTAAHVSAIGGDATENFTLTVRHNTIENPPNFIEGTSDYNTSAALLYYPATDNINQNLNVLFEKNIIAGGSDCVYLASNPKMTGIVTVRNNTFSTKFYEDCGVYRPCFTDYLRGPANKKEGNVTLTWTNNIWYAPGLSKNGTQVVLYGDQECV